MVAWRPRHLTAAQFEERRMAAAQLFRTGGFSDAQIARQLGVTRDAASKWHAAWRHGGTARLAARPKTGRPARLSAAQWRQLAAVIARWTLRRIAAVIACQFGVRYHPHYLERPLKAHGFSVQRPSTRARERDEYVIARWPAHEWVALKKRRSSKVLLSSWSMRPGSPSAPGRD